MTDVPFKTNLTDPDWNLILNRIQDQKCTPILGSAVYQTALDFRLSLAQRWLDRYHKAWQAAVGDQADAAPPSEDSLELARVAQYLTVQEGDMQALKDEFLKLLPKEVPAPNFDDPDEPYHILAELPIPIYLTTNYDDFMSQALRKNRLRDPKTVICRWNDDVAKTLDLMTDSKFDFNKTFQPSVPNPMVFHCHGHTEVPESLVLTEDDHLSFLVTVSRDLDNIHDMASRDRAVLPAPIQQALIGGSLLFIGFRLTDWSFRVVFQGMLRSLLAPSRRSKRGLAVQLPIQDRYTQRYLQTYYDRMNMRVFWGTATEFMIELRNRWRALT